MVHGMANRSQSSMEFLMTYGWAIVAVTVALATLYALGIFNGIGASSNSSCIPLSGFSCSRPVLYSSGVLVVGIGQISGNPREITATGCSQNSSVPTSWQPEGTALSSGRVVNLSFSCPLIQKAKIGTTFTGTLWVQYTRGGSYSSGGAQQVAQISTTVVSNPPPFTLTDTGYAAIPPGTWRSVASSADGSHLVAVEYGDGNVVTSNNYGVTWTDRGNPWFWYSVASSADGSHLVGVQSFGDIFTSTDYGATWNDEGHAASWRSVASSADGSDLVAVQNGGDIFTSNTYGTSWADQGNSGSWISVASSSDGMHLVAVQRFGGHIFTSNDFGLTWTDQGNSGNWYAVASSADGSHLVGVQNGGDIFTSTNYGASWADQGNSGFWSSVASSSNGANLVAVQNGGDIFTSADYGATWVDQGNSGSWISVASAADGTHIVLCQWSGGDLYTGDFVSRVPGLVIKNFTASSNLIVVGQTVNLTSVVAGGVQPYNFSYSISNTSGVLVVGNSITFATSGVFNVTETVRDSRGSSMNSNPVTIIVTAPPTTTTIAQSSGGGGNTGGLVGGGLGSSIPVVTPPSPATTVPVTTTTAPATTTSVPTTTVTPHTTVATTITTTVPTPPPPASASGGLSGFFQAIINFFTNLFKGL